MDAGCESVHHEYGRLTLATAGLLYMFVLYRVKLAKILRHTVQRQMQYGVFTQKTSCHMRELVATTDSKFVSRRSLDAPTPYMCHVP